MIIVIYKAIFIGDEKLVLVIDELPYWAESLPCLT